MLGKNLDGKGVEPPFEKRRRLIKGRRRKTQKNGVNFGDTLPQTNDNMMILCFCCFNHADAWYPQHEVKILEVSGTSGRIQDLDAERH